MTPAVLFKIIFHRFIFAISFISIIGICLFFHFYLGHEISEIETWLYYYSGTIIILISCIRLLFSYLSSDFIFEKKSINDLFKTFAQIDARLILTIFSIGMFSSGYFYLLDVEGAIYRDQMVPRFIVLLFITCIDIFASHLLFYGLSTKEITKYGLFDSFLVVVGILFFYQNLHLNLIFLAFYFGCYCVYLVSQNIASVFIYWFIVLVPLSLIGLNKVDFFSVEYEDLFSMLVIVLGHLLPYVWLQNEKERESHGTLTA